MARDRPSPYDEGEAFFIVARGPVPRERWSARARKGPTDLKEVFDRPQHGEGQALALRCGGGRFFFVARGTGPRDRWIPRARKGPTD